jgi:hypothetical protein
MIMQFTHKLKAGVTFFAKLQVILNIGCNSTVMLML